MLRRASSSARSAVALALLNQVAALGVLALLVLGATPDWSSDTYSLLFGLSTIPTQAVAGGMLYPRWLAGGLRGERRPESQVRNTMWGPVATAIGGGWMVVRHDDARAGVIAGAMLGYAVAYAVAMVVAQREAAIGKPRPMASLNLVANASGAAVLFAAHGGTMPVRATALSLALAVGMTVTAVLFVRASPYRRTPKPEGAQPESTGTGARLVVRSTVSYGAMIALQVLGTTLPAGGLTWFNIVRQFVGALNNSVLTPLVTTVMHLQSSADDWARARRAVAAVALVASVLAGVGVVAAAAFGDAIVTAAVTAVTWSLAAAGNIVVQRLVFRSQRPAAVLVPVWVMPLVLGPAALVLHRYPETAQLGVLISLAAATELGWAGGSAFALGDRRLGVPFALALGGVLATIVVLVLR